MRYPFIYQRARATAGRALPVVAALGLALGVVSCKNETEAAPETGTDYYPVAVGNYWTYAVVDSTWSPAPPTPSTVTVSRYQFKETITAVLTDAAGQKAYRLVRAKQVPPATAWRDDSVFVITANEKFVKLNRDNKQTVELVFPVRNDSTWNFNAFNNNSKDTITVKTRQYRKVGQPYTTGGGNSSLAAKEYSNTLTTRNIGSAAENSLLKSINYQQVFAKGVGPVFRRRTYFANYNYTNSQGTQVYVPGAYFTGFSRRETLVDYGPR